MFYVALIIIAILIILGMSIFFKSIGGLAIKFFDYLKNIFMEEDKDDKEI